MYTETQLVLAQKANALSVPLEAVTQNGNSATVLLVTPQNTIEERNVTLGIQGKARAEIASGLNEGDRVVIGNRSQFHDGQTVLPKEIVPNVPPNGGAR